MAQYPPWGPESPHAGPRDNKGTAPLLPQELTVWGKQDHERASGQAGQQNSPWAVPLDILE